MSVNVVIMAGGGGTRLWPISRDGYPKQFSRLVGKKTLLQHTFARAMKVTRNPKNIIVTTRDNFVPTIKKQLPRVPEGNILAEPARRDTAPSIGMTAAFLSAKGKDKEPLIMITSDPYVRNEKAYCDALNTAGQILKREEGKTVMLGSYPTYPETGYGYIELGKDQGNHNGFFVFTVKRFTEKPSLRSAKKYLNSGNYVWNMGIYGWRVGELLRLFDKFSPEITKHLRKIEIMYREGGDKSRIGDIYEKMPNISVDFALTEKQNPKGMYVVAGDYGWSDIGNWGTLQELLAGKEGTEVKRGEVVQVASKGNFVYSDSDAAVALAGVKDMIVVSTKDGVLICDKDHTQEVKKIVEELKKSRKGKKFL